MGIAAIFTSVIMLSVLMEPFIFRLMVIRVIVSVKTIANLADRQLGTGGRTSRMIARISADCTRAILPYMVCLSFNDCLTAAIHFCMSAFRRLPNFRAGMIIYVFFAVFDIADLANRPLRTCSRTSGMKSVTGFFAVFGERTAACSTFVPVARLVTAPRRIPDMGVSGRHCQRLADSLLKSRLIILSHHRPKIISRIRGQTVKHRKERKFQIVRIRICILAHGIINNFPFVRQLTDLCRQFYGILCNVYCVAGDRPRYLRVNKFKRYLPLGAAVAVFRSPRILSLPGIFFHIPKTHCPGRFLSLSQFMGRIVPLACSAVIADIICGFYRNVAVPSPGRRIPCNFT